MTLLIAVLLSFYTSTSREVINVPCEIAYEREIVNTKSKRIDLAPEYFFSFTHPEIKNFYKDKNLINAFGQISKNNGMLYFNMNLVLGSSEVRDEFGAIPENSKITFQLIKGSQVNLNCIIGSTGKSKDRTNKTVYALTYEIDKSQTKKLLKNEIDKVGIEWTSGYEEYEVYAVDAILSQLKCLDKLGLL